MIDDKKSLIVFGGAGFVTALLIIGAFIGTGMLPSPLFGPLPGPETTTGTLVIKITDKPADLRHLNMTIDSFEVKVSKSNWTEVPITGGNISFDLLQLEDSSIVAAIGELEPGNYSMIRMHVVEGFEYTNATLSDGTQISINVPSDKIKIITPTFEIKAEEITTITLDLQVDKIHLANNPEHNLSPALKIEVIIEYSEVAESSFVQNHYRWAMNDYKENPTFIEDEDTPIDGVAVNGEVLRLRLSIKNTETLTWSDNIKLKVQYTTDFTDWYDLKTGAGTGVWIFYDGLGNNKAEIENLLLSDSTVNEHFVETTPTAMINEIASNEQGEWDICIISNGASPETTYYFRFVLSDSTLLDDYDEYPILTTGLP